MTGKRLWRALLAPIHDYQHALDRYRPRLQIRDLALVFVAAAAGWWLYVPIHEFLHVAGCLLGGGTVTELELSPVYGAAFLQRFFPWITVGGDYAGRLSGFDTGGNDLTYLLTVYLPFVLTILIGVPLLRHPGDPDRSRLGYSIVLGISLPVALAGFISLPGDFYEIGSIIVSRLAALLGAANPVEYWRSDDLPLLIRQRFVEGDAGVLDGLIIFTSFLLGALLAWATYWAGAWWGDWLRQARARPAPCP